jgi:hypothetical protein
MVEIPSIKVVLGMISLANLVGIGPLARGDGAIE